MQIAGGKHECVIVIRRDPVTAGRKRRLGVNQCDRQRTVSEFAGCVAHRHVGIGNTLSVAIGFENLANADHAEGRAFRRPERAHAGGAENGNAARQRIKDFLVPDGGAIAIETVDQPDRPHALPGRIENIAAGGRSAKIEARHMFAGDAVDGRACKNHRLH